MPEARPTPRKPDREKDKNNQEIRRQTRFSIGYLLTSVFFLWLFQVLVLTPLVNRKTEIPYSDFKKKVADRQIVEVTIGDTSVEGVMKNPKTNGSSATLPFNTVFVRDSDPKLIEELQNASVSYRFRRPPNPVGSMLLSYVLPLVLFGGLWYFAYRRAGTAGGGL